MSRWWRNVGLGRGIIAIGVLAMAGCGADTACEGNECEDLGIIDDELFPDATRIWRNPNIPVCWENPVAGDATQRAWVKDAITNTWDGVTRVSFTGWGTCAVGAKGIRIKIEDTANAPNVKAPIGRGIDGVTNGMTLNLTFKNWSPDCPNLFSLEACVRGVAVHEFGHALGFAHEQNRSDTPASCTEPKDGINGTTLAGPWDTDSVMNYCNADWNNGGRISTGDIKYARQYYGNPNETTANRDIVDWGNGKLYYFNKSEYTRYDVALDRSDSGFPKPIAGNWPGWPALWNGGIDAAANLGNGTVLFIRGSQFLKYSIAQDKVIAAPAALTTLTAWPPAWTTVDAVINSPAGSPGNYWDKKVYFFRGSEYLRFDVATLKVDVAPKAISAGWPGVFTSAIDYGFMKGNKAYFFKGTQYLRFNMSNTPANEKVDVGPQTIMGYWPGIQF